MQKVDLNILKTKVRVKTTMTKNEILSFVSFENELIGSIEAMFLPELLSGLGENKYSSDTFLSIFEQTEKLDITKQIASCKRKLMSNSESLAVACTMLQNHHLHPDKQVLTDTGNNIFVRTKIRGKYITAYDYLYLSLGKMEDGTWSFGCGIRYGEDDEKFDDPYSFPIGSRLFFATD